MSDKLRPHYHRYYLNGVTRYYDSVKHCMVKKVLFRCIVCGKTYHERYEYKPPPNGDSSVLKRNKRKYGNR